MAFACAGLVVFLLLYFRFVEGNTFEALAKPSIIGIVLVPFLPAAILSWYSSRLESKCFALLEGNEEKPKKKT